MSVVVLIRGGGDVASGVALRLHRCGLRVIVTELAQPVAVRRRVSFAEAIYSDSINIEGITGCRVENPADTRLIMQVLQQGEIPVLVDPEGEAAGIFNPDVVVDARMLKKHVDRPARSLKLLIGLGPGFIAGNNCDAVIESNRGISMGRVIWSGSAEPNTHLPETVLRHQAERVLRAPADGAVVTRAVIGDSLEPGQLVAEVAGQPVAAPFKGILRGLIHSGLTVREGLKIGDVDPRLDPSACFQVSDKSLAIAGGVLEAILAKIRIFGT